MFKLFKKHEEEVIRDKDALSVKAPIAGKVDTLWSLRDGVFSMKASGDGVAIKIDKEAKKLVIKAPIDGEVKYIHHMAHTAGIKNADGYSIMVHCGTDIIDPKSIGFKPLVKAGQEVKMGDPIIELDVVSARKTEIIEHVIVTNPSKHVVVEHAHEKVVKTGEEIFALQK